MSARLPKADRNRQKGAFSLMEVMVAMGICTFVLVSLIGLMSVGLRSSRDSDQEIQAANLASYIVHTLPLSAAAGTAQGAGSRLLSYANLTNAYAPCGVRYVGLDGRPSAAASAAYSIVCSAGTTALTGSGLTQVRLMLNWPAQADAANAAGHYELFTFLPLH